MVTINIVAQSGYAWTEQYETVQDAQDAVPLIVAEHGDIERIELLDAEGLNPVNLYRLE